MCRLAYFPAKADISKKVMIDFLDSLENACGGDGNGFVAVSPSGKTFSSKGVKLTNTAIVAMVYSKMKHGWSVYYHTRKISVGWSADSQCHPFEIVGKKFNGYLCHNGTWNDGIVLANYIGCGSDTAALSHVIGRFGIAEAMKRKLFPHTGVFLVYGSENGETPLHRVIMKAGDLEYCPATGIWASDFYKEWPHWSGTYNVDSGEHSLDKAPPKSKWTGSYRGGNNYTSYGGNYHNEQWRPSSVTNPLNQPKLPNKVETVDVDLDDDEWEVIQKNFTAKPQRWERIYHSYETQQNSGKVIEDYTNPYTDD